jgi:hypothetical protein
MLIWRSQRITSSSAHYVTPLQKYFSHPSFSYLLFFFATPLPCPLHVKLRLQIAGCSKKKPSGPRSYSETPLRKQGGSVRSNLLHSFVAGGQQLCRTLCQPQQTVHIWICWAQNHFAQPNGHVLTLLLLHQNFLIFRATYWALLGIALRISN